jgi:signal peptidase I
MKTKSKLLSVLSVSFLIALALRMFVIEGYVVRGDSMEPSIHNGEYVLINKLSYLKHEPLRGDILVATPRTYPNPVIKRVAGLPGEVIGSGSDKIELTKGEYFLIGDNASVSIDSREMGPVDVWDIKGKAFLIINLHDLKYRAI